MRELFGRDLDHIVVGTSISVDIVCSITAILLTFGDTHVCSERLPSRVVCRI